MRLFQILILCVIGQTALAQNQIALRSDGNVKRESFYFSTVHDALAFAKDGDTLLLPAGDWSFSQPLSLDKRLTVLGNGHQHLPTRIVGDLVFTSKASRSFVSGVVVTGKIQLGETEQDVVSGVQIVRCRLNDVWMAAPKGNSDRARFEQNIIEGNVSQKGVRAVFAQNILNGTLKNIDFQSVITNNVFLNAGTVNEPVLQGVRQSNLSGNIFLGKNIFDGGCQTLSFENNLFTFDFQASGTGFTEKDNLKNISAEQIFQNASGNTFDYQADYQLKSAGKNASKNGSDIGLFGTNPAAQVASPFKAEMTPFNPVINAENVAHFPNQNGKIEASFTLATETPTATLKYWFNEASADAQVLKINSPQDLNALLLRTDSMGIGAEKARVHFQFTDGQNYFSPVFSSDFYNFDKPIVAFEAEKTQICTDKPLKFSNLSQYAKNYLWNFGNGKTDTTANPTVVYDKAGVYTVKLTATHIFNGAVHTETKENFITVLAPKNALLSTDRDTVVCTDFQLNLLNKGTNEIYQWTKDGIILEQAKSSELNINTSGAYQLRLTDVNGCVSLTAPLQVSVLKLKMNFSGDTLICANQYFTLSTAGSSLPQGTMMSWFLNGEEIIGENQANYKPNKSGAYRLEVRHPFAQNCILSANAQINENIAYLEEEKQELTFCIGGQQCLNATKIYSTQRIQWLRDGVVLNGETKTTLCTQKAGIYTVRVIAPNGCHSETAPAQLFSEPVIRRANDSLILGGKYASVEWFVNGISMETSSNVLITRMNGEYYVKVKDQCGTEALSNKIMYQFTGRDADAQTTISAYPNPTQNEVTITGLNAKGTLMLLNMSGQKVLSQPTDGTTTRLDLSDFPSGVYLLLVATDGQVLSQKIIKN